MRTGIWLAAVVVALIGAATEVRADTQSCAQFRESILRMERESVRPPGWVHLAAYLRNLYAKECVVAPTRRADAEYWYREDGSPLGVRADYVPPGWDPAQPYRPEGGAFTTTPEIAAACARSVPFNPGMCAMMKGLEAACLRPVDTQKRVQCEGILAGRVPDLPPASEPLPPILDLIGPARATAPQLSSAQIQADPGFQRMCREAEGNFSTCAMRRQNMRNVGTSGLGSSGQAGAFYECQQLYSGVLNMCAATKIAATAAPPPAAKPAAPPAKPAAPAPGAGRSAPAPQQQPQMSAQCQKLVGDYVSAAQANDGPRALAGYNALKSAGGCGVLDKVDSGPPPAPPAQAFPTRRGTPLTDSYVQPCAADQAGCAQAMRQLEQGASPEAKAALMMHAISTGLQLGATVAGGIAAMQQPGGGGGVSGGGTNMNSIGNRPARGTYGQGAPTYTPAPAQRPSDITGTR
ncbi:MAG TPA: hypothetical protein VEC60_13715 [Reyranella sp.]|nr:hypothetical protein [Reyranella sp.]